VELRANYSTVDNWTDWFGDPSPLFRVKTPEPGGGMRNCGDNTTLRPTFALFDPNTWGGYSQDFADVTNCFRTNPADPASAVDVSRLKNFQVDWVARDDCGLFACSYTDQLDGIELYVTLEPTSTSAQTWLPGSDCIVGLPNYAGGGGDRPNCPVMKWNSGGPSFSPDDPSVMTSIIGTFYAPGDVLDFGEYGPYCTQTRKRWILFWRVNTCDGWVNDWDGLSYTWSDRGIIASLLTFRGMKVDPETHDPIFGCGPAPARLIPARGWCTSRPPSRAAPGSRRGSASGRSSPPARRAPAASPSAPRGSTAPATAAGRRGSCAGTPSEPGRRPRGGRGRGRTGLESKAGKHYGATARRRSPGAVTARAAPPSWRRRGPGVSPRPRGGRQRIPRPAEPAGARPRGRTAPRRAEAAPAESGSA